MAILEGYGFHKVNSKRKEINCDNPQRKSIQVITITEKKLPQKQPQYTKIKLCTNNYCNCENEIRGIQRSIQKYLSGIEMLVQIAHTFPDIKSSFVADQKSNIENMLKVGMTMTDALIRKYGIEEQEDIEDLRNITLEVQDKVGDIWK